MNNKKFIYFSINLLLLVLISMNLFFTFQNKDIKTPSEIYSQALNSVVELKAETDGVGESFGTAEFVSKEGLLVTNAHVVTYEKLGGVNTFEKIQIRFASENDYRKVTIVKFDRDLDLAVLKLDEFNCKFTPLNFANSAKLKAGEKVFAIGNLNNVGISLTAGLISNSNINVEYNGKTKSVIQCNLTIAEGNSGGALLNQKGQLVGLTTFRLKDSSNNVIYGIAYCIPANTILEYIK